MRRLSWLPWPALAVVLVVAAAPALAQRPNEESLFGEPEAADAGVERPPEESLFGAPDEEAPDAGVTPPRVEDRDEEALAPGGVQDAFAEGEVVEDPLKIGGMFSLQASGSGFVNERFLDSRVSAPTLVDGYFDARPSDRVRGMVVGRLTFDPSQPQGSGNLGNLLNPDGTVNRAAVQQALAGGGARANPQVALDQAWIRFDIAREVFITVGRQHVKWGTSRIWNPTDYLTPARRNPLDFFDARLGASMVKVHVPWEATGANFYALGLFDNAGPASLFRNLGGALRAEALLFKTAEVGASALFQQGRKPKYALDISSPLGPVDVYAEAALKQGSDVPLLRCTDDGPLCGFESYQPEGWTPAVSGGVEWTFAYAENETATVGLEYFYNSNGADDPRLYPLLLLQGNFTPFYLGEQYAALYGALVGPGSWEKVSFLLFNLANLSDQSFVSRLNFTVRVHTYLTVEAFGAVHYGRQGGEFRLGTDARRVEIAPGTFLDIPKIPTPLWDAGLGLRVSL